MNDEDVPYEFSGRIAQQVKSNDVVVTYVKSGTHRMSEPENLELLKNTLMSFVN